MTAAQHVDCSWWAARWRPTVGCAPSMVAVTPCSSPRSCAVIRASTSCISPPASCSMITSIRRCGSASCCVARASASWIAPWPPVCGAGRCSSFGLARSTGSSSRRGPGQRCVASRFGGGTDRRRPPDAQPDLATRHLPTGAVLRCPRCANSQNAKRAGMRCTQCQYQFTLHPRRYPFLTDGKAVACGGLGPRGSTRSTPPSPRSPGSASNCPRVHENGVGVSSRRGGHGAVAGTGHLRLRSGANPGRRRSGRRREPRPHQRPRRGDRPVGLPACDHRARAGAAPRPPGCPDRDAHASNADRSALAASIQALPGTAAAVTDLGIERGIISKLRWARQLDASPSMRSQLGS